jgi:hypothetical protein
MPIAGAQVVLETGSELGASPIYNFTPSTMVKTDDQGSFNLCSTVLTTSAVIVFEAFDQSGNAYPPTITPVLQASNLGIVLLGGCHVTCGFPGQAETTAASNISGIVTTSPVSEAGTLLAQTAIAALDGSNNIWNVTILDLTDRQLDTFDSKAGSCSTSNELCASYTYTLPSQSPVQLVVGTYKQQQVLPTYSIFAASTVMNSCTQPFLSTSYQSNGSSPLTAVPGKQLTATALSFTGCH